MLRHLHPPISAPLISAGLQILPRRRPDNFTLLLAIIGALGAALVLARQVNYGVGLTPDAVNYISVARSLLAGNGFIEYNGDIYHGWPPLYPLLLAASSLGIFDPLTVAGPLNAALFGLTLFVVGMYLRTRLESRPLLLWCCLAIALAWPLLDVAQFAWSEMSFILLVMLALMQVERLLRTGDNSALIWAGAFTALACLTRYAGIALPAAAVCVMALQRGVALPEKARRIVIYALCLAPIAVWILRNWLLVGSPTGYRENPVSIPVAQLLYQIPGVIQEWLFPPWPIGYFTVSDAGSVAMGAVMLTLLAAAVVAAIRSPAVSYAVLSFAGFVVLYTALVIVSTASGYHIEAGFTPRIAAPLFLPVLLPSVLALDRVLSWRNISRRNWRGAGFVLATVLGLLLLYQGVANGRAIYLANTGAGPAWRYNTAMWADSPALDYLRAEAVTGTVFSKQTWPVYIYSNESIRHIPLDCNKDITQPRMSAASAAGPVYLLWIYGAIDGCVDRTDYYGGLDQLLAMLPLEPVAAFSDGVLLRYRPTPDGGAASPAADVRRDLRQHYADIADSVPAAISVSGFNIYLDDAATPSWVTYINDQCAPGDTETLFYLHFVPVNSIHLTSTDRQNGFNGYAFEFDQDGTRIGSQCMVRARLPPYAVSSVRTGQVVPGESIVWELEYEPGRAERLLAELAHARQAQPPIIQADFAVYHNAGRLIYAKAPCTPYDTAAAFFLNITPTDAAGLPAGREQHGFDDRGFNFYQAGALVAGRQCIASVALPDYDIANIHTGQVVLGESVIWELEYEPGREERLRAELDAARQTQSPISQDNFAVYRNAGRLIYAKEPCTPADTAAPFFLHLIPTAAADLPAISRQHGFDNRDFAFEQAGISSDGQCIASVALPDYDIANIHTGQFVPGAGAIWELEYEPGREERLLAELVHARQAQPPVIQANFAVYRNAGRLIYAKEPCTPADTAAPFFLHLIPTAAADLPAISRQHGFDNRDFAFEPAGISSDGQCIASVALPDYDIAIIRTGQYTPGAGRLWETEFAPAAP